VAWRHTVLASLVRLLTAAETGASVRVFDRRVLAQQPGDAPMIVCYAPMDKKVSDSIGTVPAFKTTARVVVECRVEAPATGAVEVDHATMLSAIALLTDQVVAAVLQSDPDFWQVNQIERCAQIETHEGVNAAGELEEGAATVVFDFVTSEDFEPVTTLELSGGSFGLDAGSVAVDPSGTYPAADYPVPPAPRAAGPDGRLEMSGDFEIETTPPATPAAGAPAP